MVFYKISFHTLPQLCFALSGCNMYSKENKNIIDHRTDMIELSLNEKLPKRITTETGPFEVWENSIVVFMPDQRYEISFENEEKMEHISSTVGVKIKDLAYQRYDMSEHDIMELMLLSAKNSLFIPQQMLLTDNEKMQFQSLLKKLMNHAALLDDYAEQMVAISVWFELITLIHNKFKNFIFAEKSNYSIGTYHVIKAQKFINEHYCESISSKDIAEWLGISTVYLSNIFRKETGNTVIYYINKMRMQRVCDLLLEKKLSFDEICSSVGFKDKRYVQKLFKKYYGVGMNRFQQLGHGLTHYLDNPYLLENLTDDVYHQEEKTDEIFD